MNMVILPYFKKVSLDDNSKYLFSFIVVFPGKPSKKCNIYFSCFVLFCFVFFLQFLYPVLFNLIFVSFSVFEILALGILFFFIAV